MTTARSAAFPPIDHIAALGGSEYEREFLQTEFGPGLDYYLARIDRLQLRGRRLLDAGCGTGALAVEAAKRGADVTAVDISPTLIGIARERLPERLGQGQINFVAGDMLDKRFGTFDHIVAMDSLIHYTLPDMVLMLERLSEMSRSGLHFTYAPRTPALAAMHMVGKVFPRSDRSPRIVPHATDSLHKWIGKSAALEGWQPGRDGRISSGFYISHAQELTHG